MTKEYELEDNPEIQEIWDQILQASTKIVLGFETRNEAKRTHIKLHQHRKAYKELFGEEDPQFVSMNSWIIKNPVEVSSEKFGGFVLEAIKRQTTAPKYQVVELS